VINRDENGNKALWRRNRVLEAVVKADTDGLTFGKITETTKVQGKWLSHALIQLLKKNLIRLEWLATGNGPGSRFVAVRTQKGVRSLQGSNKKESKPRMIDTFTEEEWNAAE